MIETANHEVAEAPARARVHAPDSSEGLIAVPKQGRVLLIRSGDIDWIDSHENYAQLHCGRTTHTLRATLTTLEVRLSPAGFVRLHRSALVNLAKVKELYPLFRGDFRVVLLDGTELTLKRTYRDLLQRRLLFGCLGRCEKEPEPLVGGAGTALSGPPGAA